MGRHSLEFPSIESGVLYLFLPDSRELKLGQNIAFSGFRNLESQPECSMGRS